MYCKSNVRRVINYTQNEPINKYDLWLSENARYNEEGQLEYDNDGQPACDLILKIFRQGRWEPIVGYNTAAANKINIVNGVNYPTTGTTGYTLNHLPLFRSPDDSPNELFDAGTLGQAINTYVTSPEWQQIFNNSNFYNAWNTTISHMNIQRAQSNRLGGIWANYFSTTSVAGEYVEPKFKTSSAGTDDKLYVYAGDIITAINQYIQHNQGGGGNVYVDVPFATTSICGGIYSDTHPTQTVEAFKPVEVRFYPSWSVYSDKQHRLCVSAGEIIQAIHLHDWYQYNNSGETSIVGELGINVLFAQDQQTGNVTTGISIKHGSGDGGKFIRMKSDVSDIEWINPVLNDLNDVTVSSPSNGDLLFYNSTTQKWENGEVPGIQGYPTMTSSNHANGTSYVINGGGKPDTYLNSNGEWTVPVGTTYTPGDGIDITLGVISQNIGAVPQETDENVKSISGVTIEDSTSGDIIITEIDADSTSDIVTRVDLCNYCEITPKTATTNLTITLSHPNNLPVYILYNNNALSSVSIDGAFDYIGSTSLSASSTYLFTIQFGIVRIELVSTHTASAVEEVS